MILATSPIVLVHTAHDFPLTVYGNNNILALNEHPIGLSCSLAGLDLFLYYARVHV